MSSPLPRSSRSRRGDGGSPARAPGIAAERPEGTWDPQTPRAHPFISHTPPQLHVDKSPGKRKGKEKPRGKPLLSSIPSIVNGIASRECLENSFVINIYTPCFWAVICRARLFDLGVGLSRGHLHPLSQQRLSDSSYHIIKFLLLIPNPVKPPTYL